jgi:hypothetical protein
MDLSIDKLNEVIRFIKVIYHTIGKYQERSLFMVSVGQKTEFIKRCCTCDIDLHVSRPGQFTDNTTEGIISEG